MRKEPESFVERLQRPAVKRAAWIGGAFAALIGLGLGGPPWHAGFWVAIALFIGIVGSLLAAVIYISGQRR